MPISISELPKEAQETLFLTPAKAAILVGGADEHFDKIEQRVAKEITYIKSYTAKGHLKEFYGHVAERFVKDVNDLMITYPIKATERNAIIHEELKNLLPILDQLEDPFKTNFIKSILELARHVAEASGGILGLLTISHKERIEVEKLTNMLN